jgi:hypothetical protein
MTREEFIKDAQHHNILEWMEHAKWDDDFDYCCFNECFDELHAVYTTGIVHIEFTFKQYNIDDCWTQYHKWLDERG